MYFKNSVQMKGNFAYANNFPCLKQKLSLSFLGDFHFSSTNAKKTIPRT